MHPFFDPTRFGIELIYTIIIVFLCFLVYFKTRDIYNLTKYRGIKFFRYAFLYFGLAYAARFLLHLIQLGMIAFDFIVPRRMFFPLMIIPVGYLSTMAIFYLTYSTVWKKIKYKYFLTFSNLAAILVSAAAFISRSHVILSMLQLLLLAFALILSFINHKKAKKRFSVRALYFLLTIFWLLNLFAIEPRRFLPFELKIGFQIISIFVFIVISHKVMKWVK